MKQNNYTALSSTSETYLFKLSPRFAAAFFVSMKTLLPKIIWGKFLHAQSAHFAYILISFECWIESKEPLLKNITHEDDSFFTASFKSAKSFWLSS